MSAASPAYAVDACREYEHWAAEVRRLTDAIVASTCPKEAPEHVDEDGWDVDEVASCFEKAKREPVEIGRYQSRPPFLSEIAERVAGCPRCSELVDLIRARRHARKQWGVAKRKVRAAGKRAIGGAR